MPPDWAEDDSTAAAELPWSLSGPGVSDRLVEQAMRLLRSSLRVIAAGSLVVFVGVAVNQVLNGARWNWRWLVLAVVLAVLSEGLDLWLGTRDGDRALVSGATPTLWPGLAAEDGKPLLLRQVSPKRLSVSSARNVL